MHTLTSAPPAPAWTPADLGARLALWHDASTVTLTGGAVSKWDDLSGNGRHATQGTAAARPTVDATGIGGMPALLFDGSNDFLNSPVIWTGSASRSLFVVWKTTYPISTTLTAYHSGGTSQSNMFSLGSRAIGEPSLVAGIALNYPATRDGSAILAEASYGDGASRLCRNDGSYATLDPVTVNTATSAPRIGAFVLGADWFNGHIAALLGIDGLATSEEVALIREYFRARYSLW